MTAAPRIQPSTRRFQPRQDAASITAQLVAMFGDDEGWIEIWRGHTNQDNPASIDLDLSNKADHERWYLLTPDTRSALVSRLVDWGRRYGNVYISTALYTWSKRRREWALPSRLLFIDDAPEHPPLPYSMAIETSAGNWQAYYLLAEPVDAATRQDLQRRIAYALGGDKSGHDIEQLCRVAGSFNTKRGGRFPVALTSANGPRYSVDQLAAEFPPVAGTAPVGVASLVTAEIEYWRGNIGQLLGRDGLPRKLTNPNGQTRRVLAGEIHLTSTSEDRACVCQGLVMHGYPDAEIAALLLHFCDYGVTARKGSAWLLNDIARLLVWARERHPNVVPSPSTARRPQQPAALPIITPTSRARQDRPQRVTVEQYLADCQADMDANHQVKRTRPEQAARYGVTLVTIDRIERRLREDGAIERFTAADRRRSWLAVYALPMMIVPARDDAAEVAEIASEMPQEVLSAPSRIRNARAHGEEHTAPIAPIALPEPDQPTAELSTLDLDLADPAAWQQEQVDDLPKRKRTKQPPIDGLPLADQIAALKAQRRRLHGAKRRAARDGNESQFYALERQGGLLRERIEKLEADLPAPVAPPVPEMQMDLLGAPDDRPQDAAYADPSPPDPIGAVCSPQPLTVTMLRSVPLAALTPETAPGVATGRIAADDPWWTLHALHTRQAA